MSTVTENIKEGVANAAQTVADKTNQIGEKAQEKKADAKYQVHKNQAQDPDQPLTDRVKAGLNAAGDKIEGTKHEAKGEYYGNKSNDNSSGIVEDIKEGVSNAAQAVSDKANQVGENLMEKKSEAEYEIHKNQAKDSSKPIGDRVKAGMNAAADKVDEAKHETKGEYYKQKPDDSYPKSGGIVEDIKEGVSNVAQAVTNTVSQVGESLMGTKAEAEYEIQKNQAMDANRPAGDRAGANTAEQQIAEAKYGHFFTEKPLDDGSTSTIITGIKESASNTLNFIGEKVQGTAEYIKGDEPVRKTEEGVVQSIKDGAAATLQAVGETTQQTAEYIKGKQTPTQKALHSVFKEVDEEHQDDDEAAAPVELTGDQIKAAAEREKAEKAEAEYAAHWEKVDDPSQPMATRVVAAIQCVGDTLEGYQHRANEEYWKQNK